jgi:hypothetical protein
MHIRAGLLGFVTVGASGADAYPSAAHMSMSDGDSIVYVGPISALIVIALVWVTIAVIHLFRWYKRRATNPDE